MVSDYDALQAIFDSVANGTFNEEPFERPCVKPWQPPTRPWTEIDLEAMADSTNHTLDFTVVVPPPVKVRSNASPKPSKKQSAPTTSKAPLPKQSASIPRPSIASSSTSVAKPTSTKAQKRPRPIINSSGESSAEEVVVIQKARAGEVSNGRKVDKGKGKEKEEQPKVSKKGKEREVEPSSRNERPSEDKQRRSEKDGEKQKKKSKKPRRESRSEDEDDLELSGKETVVEERFRAGKKASKGLTAYKEAVAGKSMHSFLLFLHADLFSLPERKRKEESAKAKSKQRVLDSDDEVIVKRASPAKHKRVLPKFSGGTSDPDKDSDDSEHSEESSDTSSSDEGPDERGNLKGMMVDADEDEEDEETKDLRRSTLQKHTDKTQELDFFAKTYVQWIVLQCAAPRIDWLGLPNSDFQLAFDKIEGRLNDVLDSVRSPIWRRDFRRFLDFYPEFGNVEFKVYGGHVEGQKQPGCDGCGKTTKHEITDLGCTRGQPYHRESFKIRDDTISFSSSEESSSEEEVDVPKRRRKHGQFPLGSACAGRAELYHELRHWSWKLHKDVMEVLGIPDESKDGVKTEKKGPRRPPIWRCINKPSRREGETDEQRKVARHEWYKNLGVEANRCFDVLERQGFAKKKSKELLGLIAKGTAKYAKG